MPKYVAFLRAINVGGHIVKMDQLRRLFDELGFTNVETFIASGNVIFDSPSRNARSLERKIEKHLLDKLGYEVTTFIRSIPEVAALAEHEPFKDADGHVVYVALVLEQPSDEYARRLLSCNNAVDEFHVKGSAIYWLCRKKFGESEFSGARLEKTIGMAATVRNTNTIRRIAAKYSK